MISAAAPPALALSVSPARVELAGRDARAIRVTNPSRAPIVVAIERAGYALDLAGRPQVEPAGSTSWLRLPASRVRIHPGGAVSVPVASRPAPGTRAGDRFALVLLSAQAPAGGGVGVRTRIGVVVRLRVAGRLVHRLALRSLRVVGKGRRRALVVEIANRGNVAEPLGTGRISLRAGRRLRRLQLPPRELLPGARGSARVRLPARFHGRVAAVVELGPLRRPARRTFRLRL